VKTISHFTLYNGTIVLAPRTDTAALRETILFYEQASGAKINAQKSKVLALGEWDRTHDIFGNPYVDQFKIPGITYQDTIARSTEATWSLALNTLKSLAHANNVMEICLVSTGHLCAYLPLVQNMVLHAGTADSI
jgi:hypothetical protein